MVLKNKTLYRFEGFEMDPINRVLTGAGKPIPLHSRTFDLLIYMVRNGGRLLTKDELMNAIWGAESIMKPILPPRRTAVDYPERNVRPTEPTFLPG